MYHQYLNQMLFFNKYFIFRSYKEEQLSICLRYYVNGLDVCECFLSFIDVSSSQKAIDIVAAILMFLEQSNIKDVKIIV